MNRLDRRTILTAGAFAASLALVGIAGPAADFAAAQSADATPAAGASAPVADPRAERTQAFMESFAGKVGATPEEIDQAMRDTMKEVIDEAVASGNLAANDADAMKLAIDSAEFPYMPEIGDLEDGRDDDSSVDDFFDDYFDDGSSDDDDGRGYGGGEGTDSAAPDTGAGEAGATAPGS